MDKTSDDLWIPSDRGGLAMLPVGPEDTDNGGVWGRETVASADGHGSEENTKDC